MRSFEGLTDGVLAPEVQEFVGGGENAAIECGLYVGPEEVCFMGFTQKVYAVTGTYVGEKVVLPIEIKTFSPMYRNTIGHFMFAIEESKRRQAAEALIVGNISRPDVVLSVPRWSLTRCSRGTSEQCRSTVYGMGRQNV
ncbi:uncharacterized protein Z518_04508 [Rhinocladiella mackenziei CBS 650.93]|uniref:Uncharacterized protein n=1 Tax=Rhinocladiella mackenziei CBS 650.93 TaxID=1442369 RepID=A0A0D2FWH5_9EURO|nr:uncharacterized protein Z518_04508 [Rhinocladiella mackenziei CBS 650.93]KIX06532.1 hypothetical protein Z518_04508 [Rhinocladiella mackenziei CBS 650.93]